MSGVIELMRGFVVAKTLYLAAEAGVADAIAEGVHDLPALAERCEAHPDALRRVLRALCSVDAFRETAPDRFELGPLGDELREEALRGWVRANGGTIFRVFADAETTLRTGRPAVPDFFAHLEQDPAAAEIFDTAMRGFTRRANRALLEAYDFAGIRTLVDVGGGTGSLLSAVLERHPGMRGILFDRPPVLERAREELDLDRVTLAPGDFFSEVVPGGDAYLLAWILHDWDDGDAIAILRACRRAMRRDTRLLVVEALLPDADEPHFARFGDIVMLVALGGRERTRAQYEALLAEGGFELRRVIDTSGPRSILEAVAAGDV